MTIELTLLGRIPSKKNSRRLSVRYDSQGRARPMSLPSKAYTDKLPQYVAQIHDQYDGEQLRGPLKIDVTVYDHNESWLSDPDYDEPYGSDVDNKLSSVMDIINQSKIWTDDVVVIEATVRKKPGEKVDGDYGAVVRIEPHVLDT